MIASPMIVSPIAASSYLPESSIMASAPIPLIASPMIASPIAASSYLPESGAREMVGIGLRLGIADNGRDVEVLDIVRGLAAAESNYFRVGDRIILIDGISVRGMPLSQVRSLVLGDVGSRVALVMCSCDQEEYRVTLTRKPPSQYDVPVHEADFVDGQHEVRWRHAETYVTLHNQGIVQTSQEVHSVHDTGLVANF
jgi:C-terminal processing protease CtpA/Prc